MMQKKLKITVWTVLMSVKQLVKDGVSLFQEVLVCADLLGTHPHGPRCWESMFVKKKASLWRPDGCHCDLGLARLCRH